MSATTATVHAPVIRSLESLRGDDVTIAGRDGTDPGEPTGDGVGTHGGCTEEA